MCERQGKRRKEEVVRRGWMEMAREEWRNANANPISMLPHSRGRKEVDEEKEKTFYCMVICLAN